MSTEDKDKTPIIGDTKVFTLNFPDDGGIVNLDDATVAGNLVRGSVFPNYSGTYVGVPFFSNSSTTETRILEINQDLRAVRDQLSAIQKSSSSDAELANKVHILTQLVEKTQAKSEELKAPVLLPPIEDMEVRLVASHSLERLEEYRSDENKYFLAIGLFGGAILGILSNWFTNEQYVITRFSVVFMCVLAILTVFSVYFAIKMSQRADILKSKLLRTAKNTPESPPTS